MFDLYTHKFFASRDVIFHENLLEGHKVDNYDAWHIPYHLDENERKKHVLNMRRSMSMNSVICTLQASIVHQEEEKIHKDKEKIQHREKKEVIAEEHQEGHHAKITYLRGINIIL